MISANGLLDLTCFGARIFKKVNKDGLLINRIYLGFDRTKIQPIQAILPSFHYWIAKDDE
jgi:hypothetical protein